MRALADNQRVESTIGCFAKCRGVRARAGAEAPCACNAIGFERGCHKVTGVFGSKGGRAVGEHPRRHIARSAEANVNRLVLREAARGLETEATGKQRVVS